MVPIRRIQSRSCGEPGSGWRRPSPRGHAALAGDRWPAFLGDNGTILFTATAAGSPAPDVWSVYPDGSGLVNLTDLPGGAGEGRDPSASAGGTVAFTAGSGPNAEIWTMNLDGSAPRR